MTYTEKTFGGVHIDVHNIFGPKKHMKMIILTSDFQKDHLTHTHIYLYIFVHMVYMKSYIQTIESKSIIIRSSLLGFSH